MLRRWTLVDGSPPGAKSMGALAMMMKMPKFYPELAPIESMYREVAEGLRKTNIVGSSKGKAFIKLKFKKTPAYAMNKIIAINIV